MRGLVEKTTGALTAACEQSTCNRSAAALLTLRSEGFPFSPLAVSNQRPSPATGCVGVGVNAPLLQR